MSHTTTLKGVQINDLSALRSAVAELQQAGVRCELQERTKPRMYYGNQHGVCDYTLHLSDCPYDVGFDKQADGTYAPVFDEWANHVKGQIGATCPVPGHETPEDRTLAHIGRFLQSYAKHAAINAATAAGHIVSDCYTDEDGNVQLMLAVA